MTVLTPATPTATRPSSRYETRIHRAGAVGLSTCAAAATWIVADLVLDIDVSTPSFDSISPADHLGLPPVILTTAITTLLGWAMLAILERTTTRAKRIWPSAAIAVTVASLAGPLSGTGLTTPQRIVLLVLHLLVAALFVPLISRTIHTPVGTQS